MIFKVLLYVFDLTPRVIRRIVKSKIALQWFRKSEPNKKRRKQRDEGEQDRAATDSLD
jgi:hypothetical protein